MTAPGWYPDPAGAPRQRYWDGQRWTEQYQPLTSSKNYAWAWGLGALAVVLLLLGGGALLRTGGGGTVDRPTAAPSSAPTSSPSWGDAPAAATLKPADFQVGVIVTGVECFGSAGCLVDYMIEPVYVGSAKLPTQTTVVYEIRGGDEPFTDSFKMDSAGNPQGLREEHIRAQASGSLEAVVIRVLPGR